MTRAGRWLRVSTNAQDEASQEPDIDRWIQQHGYDLAETYRVHGASAYHGEHEPEIRRAMADIAAGRIEVLVAWKSDRIERRGAEALMGLITEATKAGGRIEFVTEPALNQASDPQASSANSDGDHISRASAEAPRPVSPTTRDYIGRSTPTCTCRSYLSATGSARRLGSGLGVLRDLLADAPSSPDSWADARSIVTDLAEAGHRFTEWRAGWCSKSSASAQVLPSLPKCATPLATARNPAVGHFY